MPFDYCGYRPGSRLGPAALRLAELDATVRGLGFDFEDRGDVRVPFPTKSDRTLKQFAPLIQTLKRLMSEVDRSLLNHRIPLVVGGDHSISIGSVSAALNYFGDDLALVWVDAHADLNTPDTSPSGNIHGMTIGALMSEPTSIRGIAGDQWERLCDLSRTPLNPKNAGWIGLRSVDVGESKRLKRKETGYVSTMNDIDRRGLVFEVERMHKWLLSTKCQRVWLSFDVDVLDPILAPGTGTAVRGGLSYREMHLLAEVFHEYLSEKKYRLAGLDVVEINPLVDTYNATAKVAVEFVGSLFGKTILGAK